MKSKNGFTLIEVIVVTLIIAALALLVAPSFRNSTLTNQMEKAKMGLVELYTAVRLYNEVHPNNQLSGVFKSDMFELLFYDIDEQGYTYLPNGDARWGIRNLADDELSVNDASGVLNCRYTVGDSTTDWLVRTKCLLNRVDGDGTECYEFFIAKNSPDVIRKTAQSEVNCEDLQ